MVEVAKSCNSCEGSAPGEITISIGSLGIVSLSNSFLRLTDGGDSSCIPKMISNGLLKRRILAGKKGFLLNC